MSGHNLLARNCQQRGSATLVGVRCWECPEGPCLPGCSWSAAGVAHVHEVVLSSPLSEQRWTCS